MVYMSRSGLSLDTCMSCLGWGQVLSCLMSHDCVLTVSLSGLFCAETLAFPPKCWPLSLYLLTVKRLFLWLLSFYGCNASLKLHIGNVLVSNILTTSQSRRNLILNILACLVSWHLCLGKCLCLGKMSWIHHWSKLTHGSSLASRFTYSHEKLQIRFTWSQIPLR